MEYYPTIPDKLKEELRHLTDRNADLTRENLDLIGDNTLKNVLLRISSLTNLILLFCLTLQSCSYEAKTSQKTSIPSKVTAPEVPGAETSPDATQYNAVLQSAIVKYTRDVELTPAQRSQLDLEETDLFQASTTARDTGEQVPRVTYAEATPFQRILIDESLKWLPKDHPRRRIAFYCKNGAWPADTTPSSPRSSVESRD